MVGGHNSTVFYLKSHVTDSYEVDVLLSFIVPLISRLDVVAPC